MRILTLGSALALGIGHLSCGGSGGPATGQPIPPNSLGLSWSVVSPFGIQMDDSANVWNAGHVMDVLEGKNTILAASHTGGVWLITDGGTAFSLSHDWEEPDVNALAYGPDGSTHVFAGGAALYVTDVTAFVPLFAPWTRVPLPSNVGGVHRIVVDTETRRLVIATLNGVWWSDIPASGSPGTYSFRRALGLPAPDGNNSNFGGLALGPDHSIVAAAAGFDVPRGHYGIFSGTFSAGELVMSRATVVGANVQEMTYISLASSAPSGNIMYAVAADSGGHIHSVLRSGPLNAGSAWQATSATLVGEPPGVTLSGQAGGQGGDGWNNCIGLDPANPDRLAVGWVNGPYYSQDGGSTFKLLSEGFGGHQDMHSILFTATDGGRLYVASDGGIHMFGGVGPNGGFDPVVSSRYNLKLANLQFLGPSARQWWGTLGASDEVPGLIGGGLQDNGNVYLQTAGPARDGGPWRKLEGGDGGLMTFVPGGVIHQISGVPANVGFAQWTGSNFVGDVAINVRRTKPGTPAGPLPAAAVERVAAPIFSSGGELMYAVAGSGPDVYGLFARSNGTDIHWDYITSVPIPSGSVISAVASATGERILVGVRGAVGVYLINPASPGTVVAATGFPTVTDRNVFILKLIMDPDTFRGGAYAVYWDGRSASWAGGLYRTDDGTAFAPQPERLPAGPYFALEADYTGAGSGFHLPVLFLATDDSVYAGRLGGITWENVSNGLPRRAHCSDFRIDVEGGRRFLYLSTFGWSVWRTELH